MKQRTLVMLLLFLFAAALAFGGGSQEGAASGGGQTQGAQEQGDAEDDRYGGVIVFARSGDSVGLDPARETDGESFYATAQIYDTLVEFVPGTTEIQPALAESWDVSDDGLTYTFNLREGVTFHDGTPFNAEAAKFSFERQMNEDHPYYEYGPWQYWGYMDMGSIIDSINVVDEYTLEFQLQKREAAFLANLAMDFASIVSPAAVREYEDDFITNPVGTGPFKFVSWTKDDSIVLERYEEYWRRPAYADRLVLRVIPDATARYLALQNGEVDVIDFPSPEDLADMKADPDIKVLQQEGLNVGYLALNTDKEPFDDVRVRRALNYAVDKDAIIRAVYGEAGVPAKNPLPPTMWSYNDEIDPYPYDPERARELLAEAGYANGFETDIWAMPVARPYNPDGRTVAEIIQAQWAEVGVQAEIVSYDWGTYLNRVDAGDHETALLGWTGDNGDPDNFLWVLLSIPAADAGGNIAFWRNEEFNALIKEAKETADQDRRTELYEQAQVIFHDQAPWVPLAHSIVSVPMQNYVQDFVIYPTGKRIFRNVWLDN